MSKKENVKKIKKYIDEILNTKSSLTAKRPLKQDKLKKLFCTVLTEIQFINASITLKKGSSYSIKSIL